MTKDVKDMQEGEARAGRTALRRPIDFSIARIPKGYVCVIPERCKGCSYCIQFCPKAVLVESKAINAKGYHYPVVAAGKEEACVHCRFCDMVCPEMAIFTREATNGETEPETDGDES